MAIAKFNWQQIGGSSGGSGGGTGGGGAYYPNWKGEYFNNTSLAGAPVLVRDDRYLQFNWGFGSPQPGVVNEDFFSVRWTRTLTANPGQYRLWVTSDDGSRVYINNQLLIDNWGVQAPTTKAADYYHPGGSVQIRVEYFVGIERPGRLRRDVQDDVDRGYSCQYGLVAVDDRTVRTVSLAGIVWIKVFFVRVECDLEWIRFGDHSPVCRLRIGDDDVFVLFGIVTNNRADQSLAGTVDNGQVLVD